MESKTTKAIVFLALIGALSLVSYLFQSKNNLKKADTENTINITTRLHCDRIIVDESSQREFVVCLNEGGWLYNQSYMLLPDAVEREDVMVKIDSIRSLAISEGWYNSEWDSHIYID